MLFRNKPIRKIYLSLDTHLFIPFGIEKKENIRREYKIDRNKTVILLMASYLNHERKGINLILEALSLMKKEFIDENKLHLLVVGRGFEEIRDIIPVNFKYNQIDFVERECLPDIYNLSDIFVSASLQEVGPYTLTEALLCSIPVVSLNHGYADEFIKNNETGILVEDDSPKSLAKAIIGLINIDGKKLFTMKKTCRERTKMIVSKEKQIKDYIELINIKHDAK